MHPHIGQYIGRFAPSPTGPLHAGSLVAALASWLDARAHGGQWLVRMEDVDEPRCIKGMDAVILNQLAAFGLVCDAPVVYQSQRTDLYEAALSKLKADSLVYPCYCSRKVIEQSGGQGVYLGTCRHREHGVGQHSYRFQTTDLVTQWHDGRLGMQCQNVAQEVGDFVVKRADGLFAYQLAVVVDDADQGITHIVRGEDLADNTARQIRLQIALGLPLPEYLHVPLVLASDGQKLSKQNGAKPLDTEHPHLELNAAAARLGLIKTTSLQTTGATQDALAIWIKQWHAEHLRMHLETKLLVPLAPTSGRALASISKPAAS